MCAKGILSEVSYEKSEIECRSTVTLTSKCWKQTYDPTGKMKVKREQKTSKMDSIKA